MVHYDLNDLKFGTDRPTFERGVGLYEKGKVTEFQKSNGEFSAVVLGTKPYDVFVSAKDHNRGSCTCYLGQNDILCKHMIAVAIYAVMKGGPLEEKDKRPIDEVICSGQPGKLSEKELSAVKKDITAAMRYIKPYRGPSRIWFSYQNSLTEGCARLSKIISELPASKQTAEILVDMLLRLEKKLQGGVDDSDGAVGEFMYETARVLEEYAKLDPLCIEAFAKLCGQSTCFEWNETLVRIFDEGQIEE